jgi:hypothetical protein
MEADDLGFSVVAGDDVELVGPFVDPGKLVVVA